MAAQSTQKIQGAKTIAATAAGDDRPFEQCTETAGLNAPEARWFRVACPQSQSRPRTGGGGIDEISAADRVDGGRHIAIAGEGTGSKLYLQKGQTRPRRSVGNYLDPAASFKGARTYPAAVGEYEVKLIDSRYEEPATSVTIVPGEKTTISETLKALPPPKPPLGRLRTENAAI